MVISFRKRKSKGHYFLMLVTGKAQWHAIVLRGRGLFVLSAPGEIGYWVESYVIAGALEFEKERQSRTLAIQSPIFFFLFRQNTTHTYTCTQVLVVRMCGFVNLQIIELKLTSIAWGRIFDPGVCILGSCFLQAFISTAVPPRHWQ